MKIFRLARNPSKSTLTSLSFAMSLAVCAAAASSSWATEIQPNSVNQKTISQTQAKIQLAILLDTSSSMDGLIDQTRNQLWQVVNEFSKAKRQGITPRLEVAIYEYGNDSLKNEQGYIRQVSDLTGDLDKVSEALFSLTTNGGEEFCGFAIRTATRDLQWSDSQDDIKVIFIAGNEPFTQGPVAFGDAIGAAKQKGIVVNTIHAGDYQTGSQSGWKDGAILAGGNYMSIDHNHKVAHIEAPQDQKLAELNQALNKTYIPYGTQGSKGEARQATQDEKSNEISGALLAKRAKSKASDFYNNTGWDLVDALESETVELNDIQEDSLPKEMQALDREAQVNYVAKKADERKAIKAQIIQLAKDRDTYVAGERAAAAEAEAPTVEEAIISAVREQGSSKQFVFSDE